jgi:hypothetical protein
MQQLAAENRRLRAEMASLKAGAEAEALGPQPSAEAKAEEAELNTLRDHIKRLTGIPDCAEQLAAKQAAYDAKLAAKRAAKPVDLRIRDLESKVGDMAKAVERKRSRVAELRDQQSKVAKELAEAEADEQKAAAKLAELEAQKVEAYNRRAQEAAEAAKVVLPVPPQQFSGALDGFWKQLQPTHFQQAGCPADKVKEVSDMFGQLVAMALRLQAAPPQKSGDPCSGPAATAPQVAAEGLDGKGPGGGVEGGEKEPAGRGPEDDGLDDDEEMEQDELLASIVPQAGADELSALKTRLREQGLWVRATRRKGKAGVIKK